jgi:hypothetical protein
VKTGCNLAEFSKEGYGSKMAVSIVMMSMTMMNDCSANEFPNILWNPNIHYHAQKRPQIGHILSQDE